MTQAHLDRLSALDAAFLAQEKPNTHMHFGGIALFDGPPPAYADVLERVRSRLHLVPRYRQKLAVPPLDTGGPLWVDDPQFRLDYHLRHAALPAPGDRGTLLRLAGRLFSQRLDRSKPLWEVLLVEGVEDGGWALISKTHHAVVDGIAGVDLLSVLLDATGGTPVEDPPPWSPAPEPTAAELAVRGLAGAARQVAGLAGGTLAAATDPRRTAGRLRAAAEAVAELAWDTRSAAPPTPLNVPPSPHRRLATVEADLADLKRVKDRFGGTVNDVVLAVVAGGLEHWLRSRGEHTEDLVLRAAVPVSIRGEDRRAGNQLTQVVAPLPLLEPDPVARLGRISEAMAGLKRSRRALGAEVLTALEGFAPPTLLAQASRLTFSNRLFNLLVANVPGPQTPLYVEGRRLRVLFPVPFLSGDRSLAVAVLSYDGRVAFGLLGCFDALWDLDVVAEGIEQALGTLLARADA